ncbi:hypothetical protein Ate01nite_17400 [Actinoplanes teichomyceticus]|nr:hypothetical protein Ate01nite_17400 [Actinoplanes teichomyceticus]
MRAVPAPHLGNLRNAAFRVTPAEQDSNKQYDHPAMKRRETGGNKNKIDMRHTVLTVVLSHYAGSPEHPTP